MAKESNAVVDGDFAMLEDELQGVLKALRKADINIVAIHHHMAGERPRNAFDVPLLRDAKSLPSLTAPQVDTQRWNWSASKVPAAYVVPM